jgi:hypothetical protein
MDPDVDKSADRWRRDPAPLRQLRDPDLWTGGDYELGLAMPWGTLDIPTRLRLLRALWGDPLLAGVARHKQELGEPWLPLDAGVAGENDLYGCLRIGESVVGSRTVFLDNDYEAWCELCIPMTMVEQVYPVNYGPPGGLDLSDADNPWRQAQLDPLLAQLAARVYSQIPFELGMLGWEATGDLIYLDKLTAQFLTRTDLVVPQAQFDRFGVIPHGLQIVEGLWWTGG